MAPEEVRGEAYAADLTRAHGLPLERAREFVAEMQAEAFEEGVPVTGHEVFALEADGERVGVLHTGPAGADQDPALFVFYLGIEVRHRRKGYARAALEMVAADARTQGVRRVVLNVFAFNEGARALYRGCGFEDVQVTMARVVGEG